MDATVLERQHKRLARLKTQGLTRSTVLVHDDCRPALDSLRPHLIDPAQASALAAYGRQIAGRTQPINVAQVRQLSPFRYPGGKTWLVPDVRAWLQSFPRRPALFIEPFAGGAMAGLSVAAEGLADQVLLGELDEDVAAVWAVIFAGSDAEAQSLMAWIADFPVALDAVRSVLDTPPGSRARQAFRTIIKNRMQRGGIMAPGAGLINSGEAGRGLRSRWYPETLVKRILALRALRERVRFVHDDAFAVVQRYARQPDACFFIDPPYTAGGKRAGARLYVHNQVDHAQLFALLAAADGAVMMTYDDADEVRVMAAHHGFRVTEVPMKNSHHAIIRELLIMKP